MNELKKVYKFLSIKNIYFKPNNLNQKSNSAGTSGLPLINYFMVHAEYFLKKNNLRGVHHFLEKSGLRNIALKIRDINRKPLQRYPEMKVETKIKLQKIFLDDINALEKLVNKSLPTWKN